MRCDSCGAFSSRDASYCRRCGAEQRNMRLPVKRATAQPTVWRQAAPVLARGVALVALGVAAELALNALARGAMRLPALRQPRKASPLATRRKPELPEGSYTVSETVVLRRLTFRR